MQIGQVAKRTGFSTDTLRYYEKLGLISLKKEHREENNYRKYNQQLVERLLLIKQVKSCGFTLKEIKQLLDLADIDLLECQSVGELVANKLKGLEQKIRELQQIQSKLLQLTNQCTGDCVETMKELA